MAKVRILPQILARQIAAGEIVERPASVVKELAENSIDADSSKIHVLVEEGGKKLIRITDDGIGMTAEDVRLAFEHHATSKIEKFEDLQQVRTLGFRGEALPSIASVSITTLKTIDQTTVDARSTLGTEIEYHGGELVGQREISWPVGTEISVENLFFNVAVRRKFLKTPSTELSHISRLLTCYAIANPQIEFRLDHARKNLIDTPAVTSHRDRIFQLFGEALVDNLVPIEHAYEDVQVTGFTSLPHEQRSNANFLYLFVNGRMVRDRVLTHAIRQAYRDLIPAVAYPVTILFVELDPQRIDVNVHPTKVEIRFQESQKVHVSISKAIERALLINSENLGMIARDIPLRTFPVNNSQFSLSSSGSLRSALPFQPSRYRNDFFSGSKLADPSFPGQDAGKVPISGINEPQDPNNHHTSSDSIPETSHLSAIPMILGQFVESFIVAVDRESVLIIDQHVAHERILYDRALQSMQGERSVEIQRLLLPCTIELTPQHKAVASKVLEILNSNGFEVDWFGSSSIIVRGVPNLVKNIDPNTVLEDLLDEVSLFDEASSDQDSTLRRYQERIAISLSCRAAIKINTPLTREKMQWLLDDLFKCDNPYTCPHGRPIILKMGIEEVLSGFKRI